MNRDNNITDINEYRTNTMPDQSAFNIEEANYLVEYVSDEMINSYVWEIGNSTPDLWSKIEAGFEEEAKDVIRERKRKSARGWKTFGYVAAAVLITIIAIPVMKLGMGGEKSEEAIMMTESATTEAYDTKYDEVSDSVAMEAPADTGVESEAVIPDNTSNVVTGDSQSAESYNNGMDMVAIKGIQKDARQLTVVCEITVEDLNKVSFEIKEIKLNQYEDIKINVGDKITLSNPMFVHALDIMNIEEEITLDSLEIDGEGNILGRIIYLIK
ncbi:MAG: hypothetical protein E7257_09200 [Lachnospiraceae bacterium]|nr:hypothetical protein [Lachnospiraceae bacterium]